MLHRPADIARSQRLPVEEFVAFAKTSKQIGDDGLVSTWEVDDLLKAFQEYQSVDEAGRAEGF